MLSAQTVGSFRGWAAIDRARFPAVVIAEPLAVDFSGTALHPAHLEGGGRGGGQWHLVGASQGITVCIHASQLCAHCIQLRC